jgi:hypothetical protein
MALGSTQPVTEMSTGNFPRGKGRPARKADILTTTCEPIIQRKCGNLDVSQSYGPSRPVTGIALLLLMLEITMQNKVARTVVKCERDSSVGNGLDGRGSISGSVK